MKVGNIINEFAKKAGIDLNKIKPVVDALNNLDTEIDDADATQLQQSLLTESEAESRFMSKHKSGLLKQGQREAWEDIDKNHAEIITLLEPEEKAKFDLLKTTKEKDKFLFNFFIDRKITDKDSLAIKKAHETLLSKIETDYTPNSKYKELEDKYRPKAEKAFFSEFVLDAVTNSKISDTFKSNKRFKTNLKTDFDELLAKKGWRVDTETGEYLDKEGLPVLKGSEKITNNDILDEIINSDEEYQKKSNGRPANIEVELPGGRVNGKIDATTAFNFGNLDRK